MILRDLPKFLKFLKLSDEEGNYQISEVFLLTCSQFMFSFNRNMGERSATTTTATKPHCTVLLN